MSDKFKDLEKIQTDLPESEKSKMASDDHTTTGHEWDGIKEFDKPIPRWWLWTYALTIVFAIGYMIAYPAIPLVNDYTKGLLGWSSRGAVEQEITEARLAQSKFVDAISSQSLEAIRGNEQLMEFAVKGGKSAYQVNCIQCHASGAVGLLAYPNLIDDDWLWGGTLDDIYTSIASGIRFDQNENTRYSEMPAFLTDEILEKDDIVKVANFVRAFSGLDNDASAAKQGAEIYLESCAACHGDEGKGDQTQGAPNLADSVWLYGSEQATLVSVISEGRKGVMPAWENRLDDSVIKQLTLFLHSRGGGQ